MTDAELLADGGADSFAEFYRRHARRVAGYLMRSTGDAEVAADLTAETFAAALIARRRYEPGRGEPGSWLLGIATHKLNDWRRRGYAEDRATRRLRMERIEPSADDRREFERLGAEVSLVDMIDELPAEQSTALRARFVHGLSYAEIAGAQRVTVGAIRQRVSRGLARLRRQMEGER
jgi:RNA polymerase sigma-70 factor (ECF subfamily)